MEGVLSWLVGLSTIFCLFDTAVLSEACALWDMMHVSVQLAAQVNLELFGVDMCRRHQNRHDGLCGSWVFTPYAHAFTARTYVVCWLLVRCGVTRSCKISAIRSAAYTDTRLKRDLHAVQ